jgi:transposase
VPVDQGPPPYAVLATLVASLRQELADALGALAETRAELGRARERIAELEARLKQNSRNSSQPPSSEGLTKPPRPRSLRKKTGRKPGGQDGHEGTTLAQVARPDRQVRHEPGCCSRCGAALAGLPVTGVERRQVFDLPPVKVMVTEHQLIERECACGRRTKAAPPEGAQAPACYGPRIAADRPSAGRAVRHPSLLRHCRRHPRPRGQQARRLPELGAGADHRQCGSGVR